MPPALGPETVLIVDDEEPVRRTFREWLEGTRLGCQVLTAADAEAALVLANQHPIDLAVLDWNLGAGNNGLQLLEDLYLFNPDIVAILITGYAHQATPLDAMRMGVRDYLDKNQTLDRQAFLAAVGRQLSRIRPARRQRLLHRGLAEFRAALQKVLPLVQSAAALNDPVPLPQAIRSLFRFLMQTTGAAAGVLLVRDYDATRNPPEIARAYDPGGASLDAPLIAFSRSVAGTAISLGQPSVMHDLAGAAAAGTLELQPFEQGHYSLLAAPVSVAPGVQAVFELFDKKDQARFSEADERAAAAAADFGADLLRQALAERQTHRLLLEAAAAALGVSESVAESLTAPPERTDEPPAAAVLERLREGLKGFPEDEPARDDTLRLAQAIRQLAVRHGAPALAHCTRLVEELGRLLDTVTAAESSASAALQRPLP